VVPAELVNSADEAAAAAVRPGLPVVLKIQSDQITHKSDIGGVALRLKSEAEVRAAFEKVLSAGNAVPGAMIDGVLVAPMRSDGLEILACVTKDPTFGPVLAVGLGGVWVEIMPDTSGRCLWTPRRSRRCLASCWRHRCCRAPAEASRLTSMG
jgi:acetate---CoA ligase (ADP-forming)